MAKIIVRNGRPSDPIYREGVRSHFPRLSRKPTEKVERHNEAATPAAARSAGATVQETRFAASSEE